MDTLLLADHGRFCLIRPNPDCLRLEDVGRWLPCITSACIVSGVQMMTTISDPCWATPCLPLAPERVWLAAREREPRPATAPRAGVFIVQSTCTSVLRIAMAIDPRTQQTGVRILPPILPGGWQTL